MKTADLVFDSMVFGLPGDGINGFIEALRAFRYGMKKQRP